MRKNIDLTNQRFGLLLVQELDKNPNNKVRKWICKCDCGNSTIVRGTDLRTGHTSSCGCLKISAVEKGRQVLQKSNNYKSDGRSKHPLYGLWNQMLSRCEKPNNIHYDRYGGRGIKVCDDWHDFWSFVRWSDSIGGRPNGFTLDRIDNDGNYEPSNCRWADLHTQSKNKSSNIKYTHNGITKTLSEWALELGLSDQAMYNRYHRGWNDTDMFLPIQNGNNQYTGR